MKNGLVLCGLLLAGAADAATIEGPESGVEDTADALLIGVPIVALGLTFLLPNDPTPVATEWRAGFNPFQMTGAPRHDLALAMLRTTSVTYGLKFAVDEERPNGEGGSFPSGHTAITFAGAEFMRKHYGWSWGVPAYLAASYVGWSRVETNDHWWHDVAAGAAIGVLSNYDLGDFNTRWGDFKLKPALFHQYNRDTLEPESPAAGLRFELRF